MLAFLRRASLSWTVVLTIVAARSIAAPQPNGDLFTAEQRAFWAFQPIADPKPPTVRNDLWPTGLLDRFILAKLEDSGLSPAAPADKRILIRRATFDLIGLPPTPEEIDAFLADKTSEALAKVVDRLLASPHYGERWGRRWLDVVRYADSTASDGNFVMRFAYRYRDYVVDVFNRDKPYDQFIIEQLAGDLLPPTHDLTLAAQRVIATGFLMLGPKSLSETDLEQVAMDIVDEQIDVTGRAFLGLTLACARCHDHKFDPIPTLDYYSLAGIFRSTETLGDKVPNATKWHEWPLLQLPGEKPFLVMAPKEGRAADIKVHRRGNRFQLGAEAPRRFPRILAGERQNQLPAGQSGRLELARWIARPDNPLTARVMVNRIWQGHFGVGLVATSDNFGFSGEKPSHPELLDWLAKRFIESGWSVKALHRLIVLSATYRQAASSAAPREVDSSNRLLWRMPRRRFEAEELRDTLLAVSGRLDRTVGGGATSEKLYADSQVLDDKRGLASAGTVNGEYAGYAVPRRSLYLPVVRNGVADALTLFDVADANAVSATRNDTTVPAQAAYLLNNPWVRDQALYFAKRLVAEAKSGDLDRLRRAYRLALGRLPTAKEETEALAFLNQYAGMKNKAVRSEAERRLEAWQSTCQLLFCLNEFLYVD